MSVERKEVWVLRGRKYNCWEEGSMSVERKEVWVLRGTKYVCWEEGCMSVERMEVWGLRGRKYECWVEGVMSFDSTRNEERCNIGNLFPHLDMSIISAVQILAYTDATCSNLNITKIHTLVLERITYYFKRLDLSPTNKLRWTCQN